MPRKIVKDERTRIVEAAKSIIDKKGIGQTILADIAQEAGVPLGNVTHYFNVMDDVYNYVKNP